MLRVARCMALAFVGVLLLAPLGALATTIEYAFDTDPAWLAVDNRPSDGQGQDFGFSNTNYAGGTAGEIGGIFNRYRHAAAAYYAVAVGNLDLSQPFEMNWSSEAARYFYGNQGNGNTDQGLLLGFFNRTTGSRSPWPVRPFLGFEVADNSLYTNMAFASGGAVESYVGAFPVNASHVGTLRLLYDPSAESYGALKVELDGTISTLALTAAQRNSGVTFDTFGFVTIPASSASSAASMDFYVDNLSVTSSVPEPSALTLASAGLVGLLAYAWRKRR